MPCERGGTSCCRVVPGGAYSRRLSFMVVVRSHVNPSQWALPRLLGEMQVRFPPLATAFLSPDRPITLLFVRLCLKTPVLYSGPSFSVGAKLQEPQWVPEAAEGTKPCTYCLSSCTYPPVLKFTAPLRHTRMAGVTAPVLWGPGQCGRAQRAGKGAWSARLRGWGSRVGRPGPP